MNSGGGTMSKELLDYFDFNVSTPYVSAYTQQRSKVLPEDFEYLFHSFTQANLASQNNYKGYRLVACDGSNLTIAINPNDSETAYKSNQFGTITNHLHLNAFFDVLNRIYLDAELQTAFEYQECRACINMMEKSSLSKSILIADHGYENYNVMAHAINKGWKFVIRIKDINSNGIASGLKLPKTDTFDANILLTLIRHRQMQPKWLATNLCLQYKLLTIYRLKAMIHIR